MAVATSRVALSNSRQEWTIFRSSSRALSLCKAFKFHSACVNTSTSQVILTASRPSDNAGSAARVVGPDCQLQGLGRVLGFEEFFGRVNRKGLPIADESIFQETLIYYLGMSKTDTKPVHGVQLYLKSKLKKRPGIIVHVREESDPKETSVKGSKGDDGAKVKVLTGRFGGISIDSPLHDFTTLDVSMRPENDAIFPLSSSCGLVVYLLEGSALIKHDRFPDEEGAPSYLNEGHGLWIPADLTISKPRTKTKLTITAHPCSHLRLIILAAKP